MWEVGEEHPATEIYNDFGDGCTLGFFDPVMNDIYAVTAADPALFVAAEVESQELDGGLGRRVAVASDGAYRVLGAYDLDTDEACDIQQVNGEPLCLSPRMAYGYDHSSSPTCDVQDVAYAVSDPSCGDVRGIIQYVPTADPCLPTEQQLFELGTELDMAEVYRGTPGACAMVGDSGRRYFALGDPLAADAFPLLEPSERGAGRLRLISPTTPGGTPISPTTEQWHDTELDTQCTLWETTSGTRCVPFAETQQEDDTGVYADDACTERLLIKFTTGCNASPLPYIAPHPPLDMCGIPMFERLYELGPDHTGPVYTLNGSICFETTITDVTLYTRGPEVPLETFALVEEKGL